MKLAGKIAFNCIEFIILFLILYVISGISLPYISINSEFKECENNCIAIYLLTNGVHTDLVLPIKTNFFDWTEYVNPLDTKSKKVNVNYASFGWGDKGFYLETPTWADLKASTAIKAMCYLGSSAMHVTFYETMELNDRCIQIKVNKKTYLKIVNYVKSSFVIKDSVFDKINASTYGENDVFYEAKGKYSFFHTCNTWTNNALKAGNLKACLWTPLDRGIFYHYKKSN